MKISIVGAGYVGLSLALLLSQKHEVMIVDTDPLKIKNINSKQSPIKDTHIEKFLAKEKLNLFATQDTQKAFKNAEFIIIATPTDYDDISGSFDTSSVEGVINEIYKIEQNATIVVKSTIPVGFIDKVRNSFKKINIFFSPEFLRESRALYDNLYPSRIIIGDNSKKGKLFGNILLDCSFKDSSSAPIIMMTSSEAEAVKLFSNTFLAMRVSFFNELDSFSEMYNLSSKNIIEGVCSDSRIGNYYNNPSFGYGGYCLPKDTKQLLDNFSNVPNNIIKAVVQSNETRKNFIVNSIIQKCPKTVGIYRITMKEGSDNFRESAVIDIFKILRDKDFKVILYEPLVNENNFHDIKVIPNLDEFISQSDVILANRISSELSSVNYKVYSRDIFQEN